MDALTNFGDVGAPELVSPMMQTCRAKIYGKLQCETLCYANLIGRKSRASLTATASDWTFHSNAQWMNEGIDNYKIR